MPSSPFLDALLQWRFTGGTGVLDLSSAVENTAEVSQRLQALGVLARSLPVAMKQVTVILQQMSEHISALLHPSIPPPCEPSSSTSAPLASVRSLGPDHATRTACPLFDHLDRLSCSFRTMSEIYVPLAERAVLLEIVKPLEAIDIRMQNFRSARAAWVTARTPANADNVSKEVERVVDFIDASFVDVVNGFADTATGFWSSCARTLRDGGLIARETDNQPGGFILRSEPSAPKGLRLSLTSSRLSLGTFARCSISSPFQTKLSADNRHFNFQQHRSLTPNTNHGTPQPLRISPIPDHHITMPAMTPMPTAAIGEPGEGNDGGVRNRRLLIASLSVTQQSEDEGVLEL